MSGTSTVVTMHRKPREAQRVRAIPPILAWAALALVLGACVSRSTEPTDGASAPTTVQVLPFEVRGQEEGATYVGWAVAESLARNLDQSDTLRLLEVPESGEPAAGEGMLRVITGTLTREVGAIHARLRLFDVGEATPSWETEISSEVTDIAGLASRLAMRAMHALEASCPDHYRYIGNIAGLPESPESSLVEAALDTWKTGDREGFLQASSNLVARFGENPDAQAVDAWALMVSWDAAPLTETRLTRLRERLAELNRVDPASPYDEIIQGYVYRSSGQPEQARVLYSRALARTDLTNAARAWVLRQRSFTYLQAGNAAAARRDAEQAVRLDPSNAATHVALSKALEANGELDGAVLHSKRALDLQPSSWRQHQRLGLVLIRGEKFDEAIQSIDRACQLSESQEACANLAVALQRAGRDGEALRAGDYAKSLSASRWGLYNLSCYQSLAGEKAAAIENLRRSIELGFADALITTDPDLDSLRAIAAFKSLESAAEERLRSRQRLSTSVFPWQA